MKKWLDDFAFFYKNKLYVLTLCLTALCSYGFLVTHSTVGIDDTPYSYYFEEGLAAIVGRWVLFLVNKIFHIAEYAPFVADFAGVVILIVAAMVWSVLFYSILGDKIPWYGYLFFSGIFLSCPLISEVYTYYLHNGISVGYLCSGVSLCFFLEGTRKARGTAHYFFPEATGRARGTARCSFLEGIRKARSTAGCFAAAAVFLWIALGCYESFMVVWMLGSFLILLTQRLAGCQGKTFRKLAAAGLTAVCGILLRGVMIAFVTKAFGLEYLREDAVQRSVTEMAAWMLESGAGAEFAMVIKRIFVMYGVFAYAYYPIKVFLMAAAVIFCFGIWRSIRQKDVWIILLVLGSFAVSFLLVLVEGKATLYRSAQFLPILCGYGAMLFVYGMSGIAEWIGNFHAAGKRNSMKSENRGDIAGGDRKEAGMLGGRAKERAAAAVRVLAVFVLCVILWNQCTDMNRWFYVDYLKYENARETAGRIAYELEAGFDTSKPVIFTGNYEIPKSLIEAAYVEYNSEVFYKMTRITNRIDGQLLEKFYRPYGVWVAQTPSLSVIDWGRYAFDDDSELVHFFRMEGHELVPLLDSSLYAEAEEFSMGLPHFPEEGSIVDRGDYIVVHF